MQISIVVPLYNEEESLPELAEWIKKVCEKEHYSYEILFIDDGSSDKSWSVIKELQEKHLQIKGIRFKRNYGKSAALYEGFKLAQGDVVITMDADLQDSPNEIPGLYKMIVDEDYDLVSGWKKKRYDPLSKTIPTKLFNRTATAVSGIKLHDFNCGLKAYKNEVVKNIEVYGEMHRYIPYLAKNAGYARIGEKEVIHQSRKYGVTKFGLSRFVNGYLDLLTLWFISRFGKKPMHLFGLLGSAIFFLSSIFIIYLVAQKAYSLSHGIPAPLISNQPQFYIALTCVLVGIQLFLVGFLAELIVRNAVDRNNYFIKEQI